MKAILNKKFIIKVIVSLLFAWWMLQYQRINFDNIKIGLSNLKLVSIFCILYLLQLYLASYRSRLLIFSKNEKTISVSNIFKISWAALFLNCISPSSLVGEVFRISKFIDFDQNTVKDNFIYSSIFSKIFSTFGLFFIFTTSSFYLIHRIPKIQNILIFSSLLLSLLILMAIFRERLLLLVKPFLLKIYSNVNNIFFLNRLENLSSYYLNLSRDKKNWLSSLGASFLIQFLNTTTFVAIIYTINPGTSVNILELFSVVPVGIFIMTLPISFSGIGVGHMAFATLLHIFQIENGADVFTIFFSMSFIMDFIGLIFFIQLLNPTSRIVQTENSEIVHRLQL